KLERVVSGVTVGLHNGGSATRGRLCLNAGLNGRRTLIESATAACKSARQTRGTGGRGASNLESGLRRLCPCSETAYRPRAHKTPPRKRSKPSWPLVVCSPTKPCTST